METWTNSINQANKMALLAWTKETGIDLVQINGQRKYGGPPPGWEGDPPPSGTEVFIGKLPQDLYENVLIPLFQRVGRLYEFRLMLTFSGLNRGFAYARYSDQRGARRAIATFHNFQLQQGCSIVVCKSTEKRELSVEGLGGWVSPGELEARLREVTQGVLSVTLHASPRQPRGQLAVLKYSSHRAAALAKKTLMEDLGVVEEKELLEIFRQLPAQSRSTTRSTSSDVVMKVRVSWLNQDLKQKLQSSQKKPLSTQVQGDKLLGVPGPAPLSLLMHNVLENLNTLCQRQCLGTPLYLTKCVQANPNGWLQFWCQVVIPGCPAPFSGFTWVRQEGPGRRGHEKAKVAVALYVLQVLGGHQT